MNTCSHEKIELCDKYTQLFGLLKHQGHSNQTTSLNIHIYLPILKFTNIYSFCKILTSFDKWVFNHGALVVEDDSVLVKCNSLLRSKGTSETIQTVHSQFIRD